LDFPSAILKRASFLRRTAALFVASLLQVAAVVARGDAEIGFQQISELLPVPGVDYVGPLPHDVQRVTVFSAGIAVGSSRPDAAEALVKFLAAHAALDPENWPGADSLPVILPFGRDALHS
jgi:ABC-type molybdate transport system substrate-binding protein